MAKASKFPQLITKPGEAKYPHLVTPDTTFKKEGVYTTKLLWSPEEFEGMELKKVIDELIDAKYAEVTDGMKPAQIERVFKQYPYGDDLDAEKEETGKIYVQFKSNASFVNKAGETVSLKPMLFGPAGEVIKRRINLGSGSILCIKTTIKPYEMDSEGVDTATGKKVKFKNVGVTLYIGAVQIKQLVEYGADAKGMGFECDGEALPDGVDFEPGDETPAEAGEGDF